MKKIRFIFLALFFTFSLQTTSNSNSVPASFADLAERLLAVDSFLAGAVLAAPAYSFVLEPMKLALAWTLHPLLEKQQ